MDQAENLRNMMKQQNQQPETRRTVRLIAVTSGKGGVGKSNTSINLALCIRRMGKRVVILDADFGLANIEVMFGMVPRLTLADLIYNGKDLKDIIIEGLEGVRFISGGSGIANLSTINDEDLKKIVVKLSELENIADVVIIDTGAGIAPSVLEFLAACPEIILVTTPEPTSVTDAYALMKALKLYPGFDKKSAQIKLVANKVMSAKEGNNLFEKLSVVVKKFLDIDIEMLGCVPQDNCISKSVMRQKPVSIMYPNAAASKAYLEIATRIMQNDKLSEEAQNGVKSFLGRLFGKNQ